MEKTMATTSNCETCNYFGLEHSEHGHCYMFKTEPEGICGKHTDPWFLPAMPKDMTDVLERLSKTEQLPLLPDNAEVKGDKDLAVLRTIRKTLEVANTEPNGPICDTIWHTPHETLFDYIDSHLESYNAAMTGPAGVQVHAPVGRHPPGEE